MNEARIESVQCISPSGLHRMAYKEWGDPANSNVLVCVHGLTRVSGDFDAMALSLCNVYRVVCPDVAGRGRSDWYSAAREYNVPQYVSDMVTLLARVMAHCDERQVDWFGTSMGGLIGMGLAALAHSPIRKLVLNDVGVVLEPAGLNRITGYLGQERQRFASFDVAAAYIRDISAPFGAHTDLEWRKLAADVLRQDQDGLWILHYDPKLALPITGGSGESAQNFAATLTAVYDMVSCPTLLVRGANSDILSAECAQAMTQRGPQARLVEFAEVGHAPTFVHADQIGVVREFLLGQAAN